MDTQFTVTYQIDDSVTGKRFLVNDEYLAQYYYKRGDIVVEIHTTVTQLPPRSRAQLRTFANWHDKDIENNYYEPEEK